MSFGGTPRRSSSFKKSAPSGYEKKERKRKQEFHKHKIKPSEEEVLDFPALRERVITSLEKLGQQRFSDASGYGLENWINSYNMLLDDFEKRAGSNNLPEEYFQKRIDLSSALSKPANVSDLDEEIAKLREEERREYTRLTLGHSGPSRSTADKKALNKEHSKLVKEIERAKEKLADAERSAQKGGRFKHLFSRGSNEEKIKSLRETIETLENRSREINEIFAELAVEKGPETITRASAQERIADISERLGKLEEEKAERMQFAAERKRVTGTMSEIISGIRLPEEAPSQPAGPKEIAETPLAESSQESPVQLRSDSGNEFGEQEF